MKVHQIQTGWSPIVKALADTLHILREDCGVILPQWLPYNTILIPASAVLASVASAKGPEVAAIRNKVKRWFWCSVFGQTYENSPNSQAVKDYGELTHWIAGGPPPQSVAQFVFDPSLLRQITPRQRAIYRGVISLILRHGAQDLHTGEHITASLIQKKNIDDHHVFPQAYLSEQNPHLDTTLRDCVLNRTLIDKETNTRIGKQAPSRYLTDIQHSLGPDALAAILRSHLLPDSPSSPLWQDQFDMFLEQRQHLIAQQLQEVTQ